MGASWILLAALTFTLMMTMVKFLGAAYPAAVQSTYRQMASLIVMLPAIVRGRGRILATPRPFLMIATMAMSTLAPNGIVGCRRICLRAAESREPSARTDAAPA